MSNSKISALTSATTPLAGTETLPIVQSGSTVKVANNDLRPKQIQSNATSGVLQVTGPAASTTRVMTTPDADFSAARIDAAQTFSGNQTINNNLGLGTSPTYRLDLSTNTEVVARFARSGGSDALILVQDPTTTTPPYLGSFGNDLAFGRYGGAETFRLDSSNNAKVTNGNLTIGTAAKGVNFTANTPAAGMTSQLLNWYEEGTWTPADANGLVLTAAAGTYTRIGRMVYLQANVTYPVTVSTLGVTITGQPFTAANANQVNGMAWSDAAIGPIAFRGTTTTIILDYNSGAATVRLTSNLVSAKTIRFNYFYTV